MYFDEAVNKAKELGAIDTDGYYGCQCMDLYNWFVNNVYGIKDVGADCARNIIYNNNVKKNFKIVKNYGTYIPPKGAIAVWQGWTYGHVGIVEKANLWNFTCLEQNWNGHQYVEEITHNYWNGGPLYFLEPIDRSMIDYGFKVKVTCDALRYRSGPSTSYKINGVIRDKGIYTIVAVKNNWGKLKSGAGWICLDYTVRV